MASRVTAGSFAPRRSHLSKITPVRSVDRIPVGTGVRGTVTERLQKEFFSLLEGEAEDRYGWLTPIPVEAGAAR